MADVLRCRSCGREFADQTLSPAEREHPLCPRCESALARDAVPPGPRETGADPAATQVCVNSPPVPTRSGNVELPSIPGYTVLGLLGRGGMGVVFLAEQERVNRRRVAVKMILARRGIDDDYVRRFDAEVRAVSSLEHPNVIRVYEVGDADGQRFFSMEYCPGGTLADRLKAGPMPPRAAAETVLTLARAVEAVHRRNIIHRDLKPLNVLYGAHGQLKVSDFGLAKDIEAGDGGTATGSITGTLGYMSPEQAGGQGNRATPETDVYALGAILYTALSGRVPFAGSSVADTLQQIQKEDPVPVRRLVPNTPRDVETICLKCLQKDRARRYRTAGELADDLERFLSGVPITARPVSAAERLWKAARRRPAATALLVTLALSGIGAAVGSVLLYAANQREQAQRQLADENARKADRAAQRARQMSAFVLNGLAETDPWTRYFPLHVPAAADPARPDRGLTGSPEFLMRLKAMADRDLDGYPHERAKVMLVIANALRTQSQYPDADRALTEAQAAFEAAGETTAEDRFRVRFSRASYLHDVGELESAFAEFSAILDAPNSPLSATEVADTRARLAWLCADRSALPGHTNKESGFSLRERLVTEATEAMKLYRREGGWTADAKATACELIAALTARGKDNVTLVKMISKVAALPRSDVLLRAYLLYAAAELARLERRFPDSVAKLLELDRLIVTEFGARSHFRALALGSLAGIESQAADFTPDPKERAAYRRNAEQHVLETLRLIREAAPRHPRLAEVCVRLAGEYLKEKRYPEAVKLLTEAKEVTRYHPTDLKGVDHQIEQMLATISK